MSEVLTQEEIDQSLVISDGTTKKEVQFLCRVQTIDAVEKYFPRKAMNVLTQNKKNIIKNGNLRSIYTV